MLSKRAILSAIEQGKVSIDPLADDALEAAHINLHLDDKAGELTVASKGFVITQTKEMITLSADICGIMEGRARLAKQGVSVEQSSTFVEPGTDNTLTLEVFNAGDEAVTLKGGQEIAKLFLLQVTDSI